MLGWFLFNGVVVEDGDTYCKCKWLVSAFVCVSEGMSLHVPLAFTFLCACVYVCVCMHACLLHDCDCAFARTWAPVCVCVSVSV